MEHIKQVDKHTDVVLRTILKFEIGEETELMLIRAGLQNLLDHYAESLTEPIQYEIKNMIKELDFEVPRKEYVKELVK